jgi:hypothetical protein
MCRAGVGSVNFDDEEAVDLRFRLQVFELHKDIAGLFHELADLILWKLIVYQWGDQIVPEQENGTLSKPSQHSIQQSESQNNSNEQCT